MSFHRIVGGVKWVVGVAGATCVVLLFTLAGSNASPSTANGNDSGTDSDVLARGAEVYESSCATCHGDQGQGGTGPRLAGTTVVLYPDVDDQIAVVTNGRSGMPPFGSRLSGADIAAVVGFTREGL